MHHDELWQVYKGDGSLVPSKGAKREEFQKNKDFIMGNSHVWFWRIRAGKVEIMLQKRSMKLSHYPGWYHISAGGHINVGETPSKAAVREVAEEMGIAIDPGKLYFVYSARIIPKDPQNIVNVFLYRLDNDEKITHLDGEVEAYEWRALEDWKQITADAEANNLVPQGELRFGMLTKALELQASITH